MLMVPLVGGAVFACGRPGERPAAARTTVETAGDCAAAHDGATRAACVAVAEAARATGRPMAPRSVVREGAGYRVTTRPADPGVLDGMAVVHVAADGRIPAPVLVTDSASCAPARAPYAHPGA